MTSLKNCSYKNANTPTVCCMFTCIPLWCWWPEDYNFPWRRTSGQEFFFLPLWNFSPRLIISLLFVPSWCVPVTSYGFESTLNIIFLVALFHRLYVTLIWICWCLFFTSSYNIYSRPSPRTKRSSIVRKY